jgi:hypothetical protein
MVLSRFFLHYIPMKIWLPSLISVIFLFGTSPLLSQTINGHWYGIGKVASNSDRIVDARDNYLAELVLHQTGKNVKGKLNYYFKDSLFMHTIEGHYDAANRRLVLHKIPVIFYGSTDIRNGVDCDMTGDFILRVSKVESTLSGALVSDEEHKYTAAPIAFSFTRSTDTTSFVRIEKSEDSATVIASSDTTLIPLPSLAATIKTPQQKEFERRETNITQEIEVKSSEIRIELYDNGIIDYDSVTVYVNGKVILPKSMLTHRAIKLTFGLDEQREYTDVSMFANNEGMIPPNTAALILYDGTKRYEIQMSSSLNKTATIRLRKEKPGN